MRSPQRRLLASWACQLIAAGILLQTLFFKFTAAPESVYIFSKLGLEPWGRIGSGVAELIACAFLLVPRTAVLGALLALGVISGAIASHLTRLGIVVQGDGGLLFVLALTVFVCSAAVLWLRRASIPVLVRLLRRDVGPGAAAAATDRPAGEARRTLPSPSAARP